MIQINNHSDTYILQHSVSVTQLLGDEKSLFSVYSEERNGSRAVGKEVSRPGVCFTLQWIAQFDTKFLKCWCP